MEAHAHSIVLIVVRSGKKKQVQDAKSEEHLDQLGVSTDANGADQSILSMLVGKNIALMSAKGRQCLHGRESTKKDIIRHLDKTLKKQRDGKGK